MERYLHGKTHHPSMVVTSCSWGKLSEQSGDLKKRIECLQESLKMQRSLHGDRGHPGIAATLHKLADATAQSGDLKTGMEMFEESLRMQQSLRGAGDHLGIAITLYKLGDSPSLYKVISRERPSRALSSSSIPSRCSARCMATVLIPASQSLCGNSGMSWPRLAISQKP